MTREFKINDLIILEREGKQRSCRKK